LPAEAACELARILRQLCIFYIAFLFSMLLTGSKNTLVTRTAQQQINICAVLAITFVITWTKLRTFHAGKK